MSTEEKTHWHECAAAHGVGPCITPQECAEITAAVDSEKSLLERELHETKAALAIAEAERDRLGAELKKFRSAHLARPS